jgi:hypothetical protein
MQILQKVLLKKQILSYFEIYLKLPHLNIALMEVINSKGFLKKKKNNPPRTIII